MFDALVGNGCESDDTLRAGARRNAFLSHAAGQLLQVDNPKDVIADICRAAMTDLDCQFFFNFLFDEHTHGLRLNAFAGLPEEEARKFETLDYNIALRGCAIRDCECQNSCPARALRESLASAYGLTGYCCFPLTSYGRIIGTLSFGSQTRQSFDDSEIMLMETLSHFVSIAVARSHMEQALRECARRKDEFIATLAHELRNPLAAIHHGFHAMARIGDEAMPVLQPIIERQLSHMVRLVDDLLDMGRIATGKIEVKMEVIDLTGVVNRSIEACEFALTSRNHTLALSLPSESLHVRGDPVRLVQAIANLIDNAAKYTSSNGEIDVAATWAGREAVVRVRDNGVGIPAERLESIFMMFEQIEGYSGGLGIGLNLSRRIIEMHGGTLQARSEGLGRGSEFSLRLPLWAP
ncbi:GAF domain-containing sensor histidine kinase [Methylocystis sp. MJC1]|uniref:sensor histidine kinase n=1 Tax=Methylocystis sp. MJC1 TaxID=2654282 RepID=UPI0013EE2875|nr:GAF domain-containing sensor histidine kinase [Methylocystis sp. MJC1]MBU6527725.1 GAF domain-containing sensor histidine kinase [Methylocystis sp. MJC1]UZX10661.1 GAF domain-containing sensor histidine kinase [Methylocystis sp. MJC1]